MRSTYSARSASDISSPRVARASAKPSTIVSGVRSAWTSVRSCASASAVSWVIVVAQRDLAALEGERDGVHAVARLQLADHVAHVGAHGLDGDAELVGDRVGRQALGHEVHDLPLPGRELRDLGGRARREQDAVEARVDVRAARGDALDRADELGHRTGLERVSTGAGVQAAVEQVGVAVAGVEDHAEFGTPDEQLARQVDPAAVGQLDVDDRDLRRGVLDQVQAGGDVAGRAEDLHSVAGEQRREPFAHGLVVVDDDELRHARDPTPAQNHRKERAVSVHGEGWRAHPRRAVLSCKSHGEGHREADPPALADLVPDGRATPGHGPRDPARRRGLQRHERGCLRPAVLRRPRRARLARHPAHRRQAARRRRRAGELLAAAGELPPPADRVHRLGARVAAVRADQARRRVRLRRAAAAPPPPEPLRLALQQISWGRPSPLHAPDQGTFGLGITGSAGGHELSQRLAKVETAIFRNKTITFDYFTMERGDVGPRKVDPYHLLFQGGQFYLLGYSHERKALRVFRLSRIRGKVAYATKAEHDFKRPRDFDPRAFANRADWQYGDEVGTARIHVSDRLGWQVERHYGRFGEVSAADDGGVVFTTPYANTRQLVAWVLGLGEHARVEGPPELVDEVLDRLKELAGGHTGGPALAPPVPRASDPAENGAADNGNGRRDPAAIRPERFARLVTLAPILIDAGGARERLRVEDVCERLQITEQELREDVNVLNVVNFGGGSYVLYAEVGDDGWVEIAPEPYSDNFARPARLLPVEAKALVAAIDLIGEHLPEGALDTAREKIVAALGSDPTEQGLQIAAAPGDDPSIARVVNAAIAGRRLLRLEYYRANEDEFSERTVEPYALINGREGWYVASFDLDKDALRHFRLDRVKSAEVLDETFEPRPEIDAAADVEGWPRTGEVPASRTARVWVSPERARWAREDLAVAEELADGAVIVELPFAGTDWLVRRVLAEAGGAAIPEPQDAPAAVRDAVAKLR